ncbi:MULTISPECIES: LysR family transcriptional regulator [Rhodococcus]|uniref:LysR family transcriptional regulator n=1 Tax=Rhodococcus pseudokoreensis TaxID=2811421 RepID=A0A974ZTH2_9NOCA|nr:MULTISPECIES: LysR family transcriptional regulator [Rhodococcus]MBV6760728.1 LysR family transcriptional regulator [Rhodococcus opacus]QSE89861.1 LysR family transcriptional regulator [Rhodococcus pseudokoreensis]
MDRRHLTNFITVADAGSLSEAARRLHLSQPSVSQTIKDLERDLGTVLFVRGRRMTLTPAGRALVGPARQTLRAFDNARAAVEAVESLDSGRLDIAVVSGYAVDPLSRLLEQFHTRHPRVTLRVIGAAFGTEGFETLRRGEAELLLSDHPGPYPRHSAISVPTARLMAVFAPGVGDVGAGPRISLAELLRHPLINGLSAESAALGRFVAYLAREGLPLPTSVLETDHRDLIQHLLLAGFGAALLPEPEADAARELGAEVRELDLPELRKAFLYYREDPLSPAARAFVELVPSSGASGR